MSAPQNSTHARTYNKHMRACTRAHTQTHVCAQRALWLETIHFRGPRQKPQVVGTAHRPCDKPAGSKACCGGGCSSNWSMCPGSACCGATNLSEDKNTNTSASYFRPTDPRALVSLLQAATCAEGRRSDARVRRGAWAPPCARMHSHSSGHSPVVF